MQILDNLQMDKNGIYNAFVVNNEQKDEILLREGVNKQVVSDHLNFISKHHSIPVMDKEVLLFLEKIPINGYIIDVGGCWGWHWRNIKNIRPDVKIIIVDFVKSNLFYAKELLKDIIGKNIFLVHGDATSLKFDNNIFDGYWSVQTLQHIPSFNKAIDEAHRILKKNGYFTSYSLNTQPIIKFIYNLLGKKYIIEGKLDGMFYLSRANKKQLLYIEKLFKNKSKVRYSEILFKPELKIDFNGKENSIIGRIDSVLSNSFSLFSSTARQKSYHIIKR